MTKRRRIALAAGIVAVLVALGVGIPALLWLQRNVPEVHVNAAAHFKYGSIGSEGRSGIPYWIWVVLPDVFPEYLPDGPGEGYGRFGFIFEAEAPKGRPSAQATGMTRYRWSGSTAHCAIRERSKTRKGPCSRSCWECRPTGSIFRSTWASCSRSPATPGLTRTTSFRP